MFCQAVPQSVPEFVSWSLTESASADSVDSGAFSALKETKQDMRVGKTYYCFVRPVVINYVPDAKGWMCYMHGLPDYVGQGDTSERAFEDLSVQIHTAFQTLVRKRPFEMDGDERSRWVRLTSVIDLLYYRTTTPVTTYEIGQVHRDMIARPHRIEWITGKSDLIEPQRVPGDLMGCPPGQWIEAVVRRDPVDHSII
ncbi:MAG: hypothetical protein ACM3VT_07255, partial [Solirubrobacterales bacterium]